MRRKTICGRRVNVKRSPRSVPLPCVSCGGFCRVWYARSLVIHAIHLSGELFFVYVPVMAFCGRMSLALAFFRNNE